MSRIEIFGFATCAGCASIVAFFMQKNIKFTYHDIETAEGLANLALYGLSNTAEFPLIIVDETLVVDDINMFINLILGENS